MKLTDIVIGPSGFSSIQPNPDPDPEPAPQLPEEHWYIASYSINQELPGTSHETYDDASAGTTGSKYISAIQDESFVIGQSFAHFTAPPASPYEHDVWGIFESFIDFDTSSIIDIPDSAKLRLYINVPQIQISQELLVAIFDWGGGAISAGDWRTPSDLSALTLIGSLPIDGFTGGPYIEVDLDPGEIVLGGNTRVVLYTSETGDENSPGGPGPTGSTHSFSDNMFFEPNTGNNPELSPRLILT